MTLAAPSRSDHVVKLLVTGPFAAGKTTLIGSISDTPVVDTDVATTGDEAAVKAHTTVAMDFGTYHVADADGSVDLLLFGTPGQSKPRNPSKNTMCGTNRKMTAKKPRCRT